MRKNRTICGAVAAAALLAIGSSADAVPIQGYNFSNVSAWVDFGYDASTGELTVSVENTSAVSSQITGFALNAPVDLSLSGMSVSGTSDDNQWQSAFSYDNVEVPSTPNFGWFDMGVSTNLKTTGAGYKINGGNTAGAIGNGATGVFVFDLDGPSIASLDVNSFISLLSAPGSGPLNTFFAARFQAINGAIDDSDVGTPIADPIPEPGTLMLLGTGLVGLAGYRRKSR